MQSGVERTQHEPIWLTFSRLEKSVQTKLWHPVQPLRRIDFHFVIPGSLTSYELFFISHKKETVVKRNFGNSGFPVDCVPTLVAKVFLDFSFLLIFLRMRELRESREAEQIERYIFFRSLKNALWLNHWQPVKVFKSLMTDCLIFCSNFKEWKEPIQFKSSYYRKLTRIFEKLCLHTFD